MKKDDKANAVYWGNLILTVGLTIAGMVIYFMLSKYGNK